VTQARGLAVAAALALGNGCTCATLEPRLSYACDAGSDCSSGERCVAGFCVGSGSDGGGGDTGFWRRPAGADRFALVLQTCPALRPAQPVIR
jgi:hypothetical protein